MKITTFATVAASTALFFTAQADARPSRNARAAELSTTQNAKRESAALRAAANAPGMSKAEIRRINAVMAARKEKENRELGQAERFKFEQRLALAEASAPKITVINSGVPGGGSNYERVSTRSARRVRPDFMQLASVQPAAYHGSAYDGIASAAESAVVTVRHQSGSASAVRRYPDRYFRQQAVEASFDQMMQDTTDRFAASAMMGNAQSGGVTEPFGVPVPGKPGYITSPPKRLAGMIDVRGYNPGTRVKDPFTGDVIRVP